jgi:hypothetical protein
MDWTERRRFISPDKGKQKNCGVDSDQGTFSDRAIDNPRLKNTSDREVKDV